MAVPPSQLARAMHLRVPFGAGTRNSRASALSCRELQTCTCTSCSYEPSWLTVTSETSFLSLANLEASHTNAAITHAVSCGHEMTAWSESNCCGSLARRERTLWQRGTASVMAPCSQHCCWPASSCLLQLLQSQMLREQLQLHSHLLKAAAETWRCSRSCMLPPASLRR